MWRLSDGELPAKAPKVVVVEVGANDLGFVQSAKPDDGEAPLLAEGEPLLQR